MKLAKMLKTITMLVDRKPCRLRYNLPLLIVCFACGHFSSFKKLAGQNFKKPINHKWAKKYNQCRSIIHHSLPNSCFKCISYGNSVHPLI